MATFKVGQRVRIIGGRSRPLLPGEPNINGNGREATITALNVSGMMHPEMEPFIGHLIWMDGGDREYCALPEWLAPLTDPKADAFLERIKKLKPYDEPKVVTTEHGTALFPK